jgi:DNA invertase Pin-like site-specific DNA recombinase
LEHAVKTGLIGKNSLAMNFLSTEELSKRNITPKSRSGENNAAAKITELQAITIVTMLSAGFKPTEISRKYNVSRWIVKDISRKKTWKHLHGICKD